MFYVCDIYDKGSSYVAKSLRSGIQTSKYAVSAGTIYCSFTDLESIIVCVLDSKDMSTEWYKVIDLVQLIYNYNLEIKGVKFKISESRKKKFSCYDISYWLRSIYIDVSVADSSDSYLKNVARYKLSGVNVNENGVLLSINNSSIKNNTLVLPDVVRSFAYNTSIKLDGFTTIDTMILPKNMDVIPENNYCDIRGFLLSSGIRPKNLVVRGYIRINLRVITNMDIPNIFLEGDYRITSKFFNSNNGFYNFKKVRHYNIISKDYIYKVDLDRQEVIKVANDGSITY